MRDVQHAQMVVQANWRAIDGSVSGSAQRLQTFDFGSGSFYDPYACPSDYYQVPEGTISSCAVEIYVCEHCDQRHRVDTSKLEPFVVLDCLNCGAPLI